MGIFGFKKKKKGKPLEKEFYVKQFTQISRQNGTSGDLSQAVQVMNTGKPYPVVRIGFGWDAYMETIGTKGFNAIPKDFGDDEKPLDEVDNLTHMNMRKKWLKKN